MVNLLFDSLPKLNLYEKYRPKLVFIHQSLIYYIYHLNGGYLNRGKQISHDRSRCYHRITLDR